MKLHREIFLGRPQIPREFSIYVVPAKAGTQWRRVESRWIPAFAGTTGSKYFASESTRVTLNSNTSIGAHFQAKMAETPRQCLSFAFFLRETISWR